MGNLVTGFSTYVKLLLSAAMFLGTFTFAQAEETAPTDAIGAESLAVDLTAEERMDMLARLSDGEVRQMLIQFLAENAATDASEDMAMVEEVEQRFVTIRNSLVTLVSGIPTLGDSFIIAANTLSFGKAPYQPLLVLASLLGLMFVARFIEKMFRRTVIPEDVRSRKTGNRALISMMEFLSLVVFTVIVLVGFLILYDGHEPSRALFMTFLSCVVVIRFTRGVARFLLSPIYPHLRFYDLGDETAKYWYSQVKFLSLFGTLTFMSWQLLLRLGGQAEHFGFLMLITSFIFIGLVLKAIWKGKSGVSQLVLKGEGEVEAGVAKRMLAANWHIPVMIYVAGVYAYTVLANLSGTRVSISDLFISLAMVVIIPLVDAAIVKILTSIGRPKKEEDDDAPEAPPSAYSRILIRAARLLILIGAVMVLASIWGIDFFGMASHGIGGTIMRTAIDIGLTCLVTYVVWELVKAAIDKQMAGEEGETEAAEGEGGGAGGSRLVTLLPLIRKFLLVTIMVMAAMIILSSLGVDIGPMIAGAGVIGLAVGFGAQTLVKDIVSGVFFLVDDAFRLNEYVDVGSVKGTVERINVRSLTLRHHLGPLHTIPFGEIGHLTNFSRDWVIMKMVFRVTYDTDMKKVKKIFKKIGQDMLADETLGPGFLEPFKSQGVKAMEDSAMIIRAKFKTIPGAQFSIRKEAYQRVQAAFKEAGIEFAHRRVSVDLPEGIDPKSAKGEAVIEAAGAAIAAEAEKEAKPK